MPCRMRHCAQPRGRRRGGRWFEQSGVLWRNAPPRTAHMPLESLIDTFLKLHGRRVS